MIEDKDKPLVSIIIPAYNAGRYIREAVDSALAQTYKNCEVIVVDDGSSDNTRQVLAPYIDAGKIKYIYQENKGLAGARNTGIKNSSGEYIALLDADDIFLPTKLEHQVSYLKTHPECDISYCDIYHFYDEEPGRLMKLNYRYYSGGEVFINLLKKNFINPLAVVFRRDVFRRFGYFFNENAPRSEDWDCWVNLAWRGARFCFLPEALAKYRIRKDSLSYSRQSEVQRKGTALGIFERLKKQMSPAERKRYRINFIIFFHRLKLFYAKLASHSAILRKIHALIQSRRLK
jgi:glycosyltransferase involved in cell wall biosynthesis